MKLTLMRDNGGTLTMRTLDITLQIEAMKNETQPYFYGVSAGTHEGCEGLGKFCRFLFHTVYFRPVCQVVYFYLHDAVVCGHLCPVGCFAEVGGRDDFRQFLRFF